MLFYMAEKEAFEFMEGIHSLKEWASFGFNAVYFEGHKYYDNCNFDGTPISDAQNEEAGELACIYKDYDDDGHLIVHLAKLDDNHD